MWFSIPFFRYDPKVNTYSTCLSHRLILLTNWLIDYQTKLINEWRNECLFNASLICHKECGNKREKSIFSWSPDCKVSTKDHIWLISFYYHWKRGEWLPSGLWQVCSWWATKKKCIGNKHVIVIFEDMLFHEPVEASFLWP